MWGSGVAIAAALIASGVGICSVSLYATSAVARLDHRADLIEIKLRELDARELPTEEKPTHASEPRVESTTQESNCVRRKSAAAVSD